MILKITEFKRTEFKTIEFKNNLIVFTINSSMSKKTIEEIYKKLTQREHVLLRPDTYIGSVKKQMEELWLPCNKDDTIKMEKTMVEYSPGFIKIFDEVLTNATDHSFRDSTVKSIKVEYSQESGEISVWNDGNGIPIELHKEHNIYVPELIFGHLLSGSNYLIAILEPSWIKRSR
jgi:DNA topoisomerase-2